MLDKILPWIGGVFAVVGIVLIFIDVIGSIKRRDRTKTNVAGLVILSIAIVGYVITDLILVDSAWPPLASIVWILLFWVYVILDACMTMGKIKMHRREKKTAAAIAKENEAKTPEEKTWEEIVENTTGKIEDASNQPQEEKKQ